MYKFLTAILVTTAFFASATTHARAEKKAKERSLIFAECAAMTEAMVKSQNVRFKNDKVVETLKHKKADYMQGGYISAKAEGKKDIDKYISQSYAYFVEQWDKKLMSDSSSTRMQGLTLAGQKGRECYALGQEADIHTPCCEAED